MAASEEARTQARKDLRSKIKLEKDFKRKLTRLNNKIIKKTVVLFGRDSVVLNAREFEPALEGLLIGQYERTQKVFENQVRDILPKELESTNVENALIAGSLSIFFANRKIEQSQIITRTNQRDINRSIVAADRQLTESAEVGAIVTNREVARTAGTLLRRKLKGRSGTIATTEIQVAAEISKAIEANVLTRTPFVLIRMPPTPLGLPPPKLRKEWVSAGDEKVRRATRGPFSHVAADGQIVDVDKPFIVSGQRLMIPGDTSLGASLGNVVRCRCASVRRKRDILNARKSIFDAETRIETETEVDIPEFGFTP